MLLAPTLASGGWEGKLREKTHNSPVELGRKKCIWGGVTPAGCVVCKSRDSRSKKCSLTNPRSRKTAFDEEP